MTEPCSCQEATHLANLFPQIIEESFLTVFIVKSDTLSERCVGKYKTQGSPGLLCMYPYHKFASRGVRVQLASDSPFN